MLPYSVMSYKLTEFYALAIPLFVPSPRFYINHIDPDSKTRGIGPDRASTSRYYCNSQPSLELEMRPALESNLSPHIYSPNLEFGQDAEAEMYWMQGPML
jgi:hypothetical protein